MDSFVLWGIASAIAGWLYNFWFKVISQRNYNTYLTTIYSHGIAAFLSFCYLAFFHFAALKNLSLFVVLAVSLGNVFFFFLSVLSRVESMKNIDTVIFYPLYKTFWPILVTAISLFYFWESLTQKEALGIIVGIILPLFLITKTENQIQKNLKLGLFFMILTSIFGSISPIFVKLSNNADIDFSVFLFVSFLFWVLFSYIGYLIHEKHSKKKVYREEWMIKFSIIIGVCHFFAFLTFVKAFEWNIAIAFTINSFSILIPIILSILFYGEHFNFKKAIVIFLSLVSLFLFL